MIDDPQKYAQSFIDAGADLITFHLETCSSHEEAVELIDHLHAQGVKVGVTLRPSSDYHRFEPYLAMVDLVLVMSVEPGFGGQAFMPSSLNVMDWLAQIRTQQKLSFLIEVDGGINAATAKDALAHHTDVFVAGSYIFKDNIAEAINALWAL